jgi:hypothetical protein
MSLASCPICNAWLAPDESCLHIPALTPGAELPTVETRPFGLASCGVSAVGFHSSFDSAGGTTDHA